MECAQGRCLQRYLLHEDFEGSSATQKQTEELLQRATLVELLGNFSSHMHAVSLLSHHHHITIRCELSFPCFPGLVPGQDEQLCSPVQGAGTPSTD